MNPQQERAKTERYAASHSQKRLWVLQELDPGSTAYSLPGAILLEGSLDISAFQMALDHLVERHESLRTTFDMWEGQLCQVIHPAIPVHLEQTDLSSMAESHAGATRLVANEAAQPFDLRRGPLFRTKLICLAPDKHVFAYNLHHIITDEASKMILVRELNVLYSAKLSGEPEPLLPLQVQYRDFAAWQNDRLSSSRALDHRRYWQEKFSGDLPLLELTPDFPRPPLKTFSGRCLHATWEPELVQRLSQFSRAEKTTLFLILMALVRVQLFRYTNQTDSVIGTPVAGREEPELENQIGFYANTLPLRLSVSSSDSFCNVLRREKETFLEAYDHQLYPFDQLVADLNIRRDLSRAPVFEISVHLQNIEVAQLDLESLHISPFPFEISSVKLDLAYDFIVDAGGLHSGLTYNTDLFNEERIRLMQVHLRQLAEQVLERPRQRIDRLEISTAAERKRILCDFNAGVTSSLETTIVALFQSKAWDQPDSLAVDDGQVRLTFGELNAKSNQLAHYLIEQGVGLETRVGVFLERSADWVVAVLGIMKAGGVYFPLNPNYPLDRLVQLLTDAEPPVVITSSDLEDSLPSYFGYTIRLDLEWEGELAAAPSNDPKVSLSPRNGAYLIYTSGSTGTPKGVLVEHGGFTNMIRDQIARFGVNPDDRGLQFSSISFDASIYEVFLALLAGACIVPISRAVSSDVSAFLRFLEAMRISVATLPPSFLRTLGAQSLGAIRLLITAGEAAAREICLKTARDRVCINAYGPTEASVCASSHKVEPDGDYGFGIPIGRPVSNGQLYILDTSMNVVPIGVLGELWIGGAGLARGYLDQPEATAMAFLPDPFGPGPGGRLYRTGDLARWNRRGEVEFIGRRDHQVKVRGHRIELGEVEAALNKLPELKEAVAMVSPGPDSNLRLIAYVIPAKSPLSVPALRTQLLKKLPDSLVPDRFIEVANLPLTAAGKIDRHALSTHKEIASEQPGTFAEPRNDLERVLAGIYAKVIGLEKVSICDSFFDLGGNSLMATQVVSRIRDLLRTELSVVVLFESPTIEQLALRLLREHSLPVDLERIASVVLKFESLSEEDKCAVLAKARERAGEASVR
jgi:amino acid adenylation domain-containing protein